MLSVIMLSAITVSFIIPSVIMPSVIMPNVVAPDLNVCLTFYSNYCSMTNENVKHQSLNEMSQLIPTMFCNLWTVLTKLFSVIIAVLCNKLECLAPCSNVCYYGKDLYEWSTLGVGSTFLITGQFTNTLDYNIRSVNVLCNAELLLLILSDNFVHFDDWFCFCHRF
jgi:hypothetical protein